MCGNIIRGQIPYDLTDLKNRLPLADEEMDNLKKAGRNSPEREPEMPAPVANKGFEITEIKDIFKYHT